MLVKGILVYNWREVKRPFPQKKQNYESIELFKYFWMFDESVLIFGVFRMFYLNVVLNIVNTHRLREM